MQQKLLALIGAAALVCSAAPASADLPAGASFDNAYTWFEVESHHDTRDGRQITAGWTLGASVRVIGRVERGSLFKFDIKKDNRTLTTFRCTGNQHLVDDPGDHDFFYATANNCDGEDENRVTETGDITVDVYFVDAMTDEETLLRSHQIQLGAVTRENRAPIYYVNRASETLSTLIWKLPRSVDGMNSRDSRTYNNNAVEIVFNYARPREAPRAARRGDIRCSVNGEVLRSNQRAVAVRELRFLRATTDDVNVHFVQANMMVPITWGEGDREAPPGMMNLDQNPGEWSCDWRYEGATLRTFEFTVADGEIVAHPEEANGLSLRPTVHLARTIVPADSPLDERLVPAAVRAGAFHGRPWTTDAARETAAAMPSKGDPMPGLSTGRRRGGRRGRGMRR